MAGIRTDSTRDASPAPAERMTAGRIATPARAFAEQRVLTRAEML
ncbi:MAG: hypothetical protein QOF54_444, partial [Solirubrobacteraceae bacterium]|nr:hypothetical protein [Solirubrobacteraceae bacterium]